MDNKRAETLASRGLTDENIIIEILKNESPVPERLPAEMYDKVNYMCRRWMDRIARFEIDYDFVPDTDALKNIIICMLESAPVFHSSFVDNHIRPYWKVEDYHIGDVFSAKETDDLRRSADDFLLSGIDVKNNVQIRIALFICGAKSKLCFIFNHMCMDGGGLKSFLNDMFRAYDRYIQNRSVMLVNKNLSRAYGCVYNGFRKDDKKRAKKLFANVSAGDKHSLPLSERHEDDEKMIVRKKISRDIFEPARIKAKEYGATVNDLVSAAYIRAFYETSGCNHGERVGISCAVDLRRYINNPESIGYTNHTAFMPCVVESMGETMADTLKAVVKSTKEAKSDKFMGLHGLPLLNIGYSTMIYAQAELVVGAFYNNANLSVSNVGKMEPAMLSLGGNAPTAVAVAGGAKEKPCAAMNALSYNGDLMLSICIKGNESDRRLLSDFLNRIEENIKLI
ncbi:MAG: hypothetical protein ACI4IX_06340 [Acutalibacteraceae bacterium]